MSNDKNQNANGKSSLQDTAKPDDQRKGQSGNGSPEQGRSNKVSFGTGRGGQNGTSKTGR